MADGSLIFDTRIDSTKFKKGLKDLGSTAKKGFATIGKIAKVGIASFAALGGSMLALAESTREYRAEQAKLNTAFQTAGFSSRTARQAFTELNGVLGDTGQATEAAQLLASLATSQEDVAKWTDISAGVVGTFGDSLPIESLIEASNETAKVGKVTGTLADALNWAGVSEDEFNKKLAQCADETERTALITDTLNGLYDEAAEKYKENNELVIEARKAQENFENALSKVGERIEPLITDFKNFAASAITNLIEAFEKDAAQGVGQAAGTMIKSAIKKLADNIPEFLSKGLEFCLQIANGLIEGLPDLLEAVPQMVGAVVKSFDDNKEIFENIGLNIAKAIVRGFLASHAWVRKQFAEFIRRAFPVSEITRTRGTDLFDGSHANGLNYVPYDGYVAQLHRGEMVVPAYAASGMRSNGGWNSVQTINNNTTQTVKVVPSGGLENFAELIYDPIQRVDKQRGHTY